MALKVLHLISLLNPGGIEMWLMSMLRQGQGRDIAFDFLCKSKVVGTLEAEAEALGASVFHVPLRPDHLRFLYQTAEVIRSRKYDLLHNHLASYSALPVVLGQILRIPVISSYHSVRFTPEDAGLETPVLRQIRAIYGSLNVGYALRHSAYVTGCSDAVLANLAPDFRSRPNFRTLYYGIAIPPRLTAAERSEIRRSLSTPDDAPVLLHVGRFHESKGHPQLLSIYQGLRKEIPDLRLWMVGNEGPALPKVEAFLAQENLAPHAQILGRRSDVPRLMQAADLFVFPSRHEGFGLVALEAAAAGLPFIGSDLPALREAVLDHETGLLFPPEATDAMTKAALFFLRHPDEAQRLAQKAHTRAASLFSQEASYDRLRQLYLECLSAPQRPSHASGPVPFPSPRLFS